MDEARKGVVVTKGFNQIMLEKKINLYNNEMNKVDVKQDRKK